MVKNLNVKTYQNSENLNIKTEQTIEQYKCKNFQEFIKIEI